MRSAAPDASDRAGRARRLRLNADVEPADRTAPRVAFVNGGILGLSAYAAWLRRTFTEARELHAEHFVLTEGLTPSERIIRRLMCQRLWPDPEGLANLDLARFRQELHAGVQARRRLLARGLAHFDVLHFHRQATAYGSLDLMERLPAIVSIDCTQICAMQDLTRPLERWTLGFNVRRDREVFRRAAAIVSTSRWAAAEVRRDDPELKTPVRVLPPPVAIEAFDEAWIDERLVRARTGTRTHLLFVGGDFPRKGGYDLLSAWTAGGFHERAELTMVSDWPIDVSNSPGVRIRPGIRGYTPEWLELWRSADIFVMPTRNEAFGLVYQEAAAAGVPAIGSDLNAVPEIIQDGRTGLLVKPRDQAALVGAIDRLLQSPVMRSEMGRAARDAIARQSAPEIHRQQLVDLVRTVRTAGAPGRRPS